MEIAHTPGCRRSNCLCARRSPAPQMARPTRSPLASRIRTGAMAPKRSRTRPRSKHRCAFPRTSLRQYWHLTFALTARRMTSVACCCQVLQPRRFHCAATAKPSHRLSILPASRFRSGFIALRTAIRNLRQSGNAPGTQGCAATRRLRPPRRNCYRSDSRTRDQRRDKQGSRGPCASARARPRMLRLSQL